jgi:hypothetical protein
LVFAQIFGFFAHDQTKYLDQIIIWYLELFDFLKMYQTKYPNTNKYLVFGKFVQIICTNIWFGPFTTSYELWIFIFDSLFSMGTFEPWQTTMNGAKVRANHS